MRDKGGRGKKEVIHRFSIDIYRLSIAIPEVGIYRRFICCLDPRGAEVTTPHMAAGCMSSTALTTRGAHCDRIEYLRPVRTESAKEL